MQSSRTAPRLCKTICLNSPQLAAAPKRSFSIFSPFPYIPSSSSIAAEVAPLFRLLDQSPLHPRAYRWAQRGVPRFDVRERSAAFELQGEVPGLQQGDVTIEFVDSHTLVIRGKVEREANFSNVKNKEGDAQQEEITGSSGRNVEQDTSVDGSSEGRGVDTPTTTASTNTAKADAEATIETKQTEGNGADDTYKYWVSERVTGGFERHFTFPSDVDQEAVKASLKNGILSVVVPKILKRQKRIVVEGE